MFVGLGLRFKNIIFEFLELLLAEQAAVVEIA